MLLAPGDLLVLDWVGKNAPNDATPSTYLIVVVSDERDPRIWYYCAGSRAMRDILVSSIEFGVNSGDIAVNVIKGQSVTSIVMTPDEPFRLSEAI